MEESEITSIPCQRFEPTPLSEEADARITVSEPIREAGLSMLITTLPFQWSTRRSLEDLLALRHALLELFPHSYVPPPLPKRLKGKSKDESVTKTLRFAQHFLQSVVAHPVLRRSQECFAFLASSESLPRPKAPDSLGSLQSDDGSLLADQTRDMSYLQGFYAYFAATSALQRSLKRQSVKLEAQLRELGETLTRMSEGCKELVKLQRTVDGCQLNEKVFAELDQVLLSWNRAELERLRHTKEFLSAVFKYTYNEAGPMTDLMKRSDARLKAYAAAEAKLQAKKEKLWTQGDVAKWEVEQPSEALKADKALAFEAMLPTETARVRELRDSFGVSNYQLKQEIATWVSYSARRNVQVWEILKAQEIATCSRQLDSWRGFLSGITN